MPVDVDGFAIFGAMARHPDTFGSVAADASKMARTCVVKQLKEKNLAASQLRGVAAALGQDTFDLIADGLSDAEIKAVLTKVDKHNPALKDTARPQREALGRLAHGEAEPHAKPESRTVVAQAPKTAKPKVERSGNSRAMKARKL